MLVSACKNCGTSNQTDANFCSKCGFPLQLLNKRYYIIEEIATGGVGTVFRAEDTACFNKTVAIKKFKSKSGNGQLLSEAEEKCHHESAILAALNHHSIPKVWEYFSVNDDWYLVTDFIEGVTLEYRWETAKRRTRLSIEEILTIGIELCGVLKYLHERDMLFIDLKPSNIMLGKSDQHVYLIDFGSAHYAHQSQSRRINHMVTQGYAAPELDQSTPSPRSDIYSLGAILSQLILGRKPSGSTMPILKQSRVSPDTPPTLLALVQNMMQENENNRPGKITDVQQELQKIRADTTKPLDYTRKVASGRRAFLIASFAAGTAAIASGVATFTWFNLTKTKSIPFPLTIGGKLDDEAALLTEMYVLLLADAGFKVTDKARLGDNETVFNAIKAGVIDLYPEFLLTGLQWLRQKSSGNQQLDFQTVGKGFQNFQITWLDQAKKLDDNYCVAMLQPEANQFGIKTLSDLAQVMKRQTPPFLFAVAPDVQQSALPTIGKVYGILFNSENTLQFDEKETFAAVLQGIAQVNVCISTDPLIKKDNFVRLTDDRNALPIDTPSPIIRNEILYKEPQIATILQPLARLLSVEVSTELQEQMLNGQSVTQTASGWLKSQGLL